MVQVECLSVCLRAIRDSFSFLLSLLGRVNPVGCGTCPVPSAAEYSPIHCQAAKLFLISFHSKNILWVVPWLKQE